MLNESKENRIKNIDFFILEFNLSKCIKVLFIGTRMKRILRICADFNLKIILEFYQKFLLKTIALAQIIVKILFFFKEKKKRLQRIAGPELQKSELAKQIASNKKSIAYFCIYSELDSEYKLIILQC